MSEKNSEAPDPAAIKPTGPTLVYTSDDDELAFAAISEGCKTYGAIATTTRIGATRAFQSVERLKSASRIRQANDGTLTVVGGAR